MQVAATRLVVLLYPSILKKSKASGRGLQIESVKEGISKAFSFALAIGWSFSLSFSSGVYRFFVPLGSVSFFVSTILFLYLFAPVAIWSRLIKKKNYGTICVCVLVHFEFVCCNEYIRLVSGLGFMESLAIMVFALIICVLTFVFVNWMFFDFP